MGTRRVRMGWLGLAVALTAAPAAESVSPPPTTATAEADPNPAVSVPLEALPLTERERVRLVLERPTLTASGLSEVFTCRPEHYQWLLDHPDQAVRLWRCLGIKSAEIIDRGGYFTWNDDKGSAIRWHEVYRSPDRRIWYAEGKVNPGFLLPTAAVQAVVVLHHTEGTDAAGRPAMRHHIELAVHADSRLLAAGARLIGASVPHLAQQYVGQIQMFYGALAWYLNQHPRHAEILFEQMGKPASTDRALTLPSDK